ncbi:NADH dehydrogenase [ubiquinone] 1 alpha subcomplex subunit 10, mitochondrial [Planococcus citri]|uniref:NADH dehydrogenase [ubiquinone] 1 alpha subcomplex subunit 10, mitochondrial n=1 Tax=Planococcus citri TaxID=170843 RepID=UPI0031F892F7
MLKLSGISCIFVGSLRSNLSKQAKLQLACSNFRKNATRTMITLPYKEDKKKPAPWPYQDKTLTPIHVMMDLTLARFDENTKLIIVEGPINSGKREVAKKIAEAFGILYMPPPTMDIDYINAYGYDMRNLDPKLPESLRSFDEKKFNLDPTHPNAATFQLCMYKHRFVNHLNALRHILNTGEGVVTVGSPFSDFVWAEAMFQCGYISPQIRNYYYEVVRQSIHNLYRPHLIVYLDVPVNKTIENIKTRGADYEVNSKALTPEFLQSLEKISKEKYLREADVPGSVLMADFSEEEDVDNIIEDIENIDFDSERHSRDPKYADWRKDEWWQDWHRLQYTRNTGRCRIFSQMNFISYDTPELFANESEWDAYQQIWKSAPGMEYARGFNPKRGDKNIMLKVDERFPEGPTL